jgi:hypothetical protein
VTTSPAGTPRVDAGVLGEPGTEVLFGQESVNDRPYQGGRLTFGYWLDDAHTFSWEAQLWMASPGSASGENSSDGDPIFARPFFNTETGLEDAQLVAYPSVVTGAMQIDARIRASSVNVLGRCNWLRWDGGHLDFSGGYRFFRFRESLSLRESLVSTIRVVDDFDTVNDFHGVDLGAVFGLRRGGWLFDVTTKVALGDMRQRLDIEGSTTVAGNPSVTVPGGWLAAPSNIGVYTNHEFVAIPELGLRVAFVAFDIIQLSVGYNMMYVSSVIRTGSQIDDTINPSQLAPLPLARGGGGPSGESRPQPSLNDSDLWMHGINFGAELRW